MSAWRLDERRARACVCCNSSADCFWCPSKGPHHWHLIQASFKPLTLLAVYFGPMGPRRICWFWRSATGGPDRRGSMPLRTPRLREYGGARDPAGRSRGHAGYPGWTVRRLATLALNSASGGIGRGAAPTCSKLMARSSPARRWTARFPLSSNGTRPLTSAPTPVPRSTIRTSRCR